MSDAVALTLSLIVLAVALASAVMRPRWLPEAVAAPAGAALLVATGALSVNSAGHALSDLAPTVGFLAALLVLAEGCRREGLFAALGAVMVRRARGHARGLLAAVFLAATAVTATLSLDATIVLLTPVVFGAATRMRTSTRPPVYACSHLANSSSLLLPVSNLTNLLAFHASGLSFARFGALMALPTAAAVGVEWLVFSRFFATELDRPRAPAAAIDGAPALPRRPLGVLALTLAGFALSPLLGIAPVWIAVAGAAALTLPALVRSPALARPLAEAAEPGFLVFILGLGVIVAAASANGLGDAVGSIIPAGASLPALLLIAVVGAVLANLLNNLPATLILVPVAALGGAVPVLAVLIGVNIGPNLTYAGSLATLLWRRVLRRHDTEVEIGAFLKLGALTVPACLLSSTVLLWFAAKGLA